MNYYQNENENQNDNYPNQDFPNNQLNYERMDNTPSGMAVASLIIGIISIVSLCCPILSIILGALGIIFSLLSRRRKEKISGNAQIGMILSVLGLVLGFLVMIGTVIYVIRQAGNENVQKYLKNYEEQYGDEYNGNTDIYDYLFNELENSL